MEKYQEENSYPCNKKSPTHRIFHRLFLLYKRIILSTIVVPFGGLFQSPSLFRILFPFLINNPGEAALIALLSIWNGPSSGMKKRGFQALSEAKAISYAVP